MRKYIVIRFSSVEEGINFMSTYEYSSSFIVDSIIYDKNGNTVEFENILELVLSDIRNVILFKDEIFESEICYDGDNLFIDKPLN